MAPGCLTCLPRHLPRPRSRAGGGYWRWRLLLQETRLQGPVPPAFRAPCAQPQCSRPAPSLAFARLGERRNTPAHGKRFQVPGCLLGAWSGASRSIGQPLPQDAGVLIGVPEPGSKAERLNRGGRTRLFRSATCPGKALQYVGNKTLRYGKSKVFRAVGADLKSEIRAREARQQQIGELKKANEGLAGKVDQLPDASRAAQA